MATRAPKKTTAATKPPAETPAVLTCPECGKTFTRAAAMGAHRSRIHGIAGNSQNARRKRTTTAATAKPAAPTKRTPTRRRTPTAAANGRSTRNRNIDRDALLKTLFPNGIPARQDAIAAVNDWLNEADRLSRL